MLAELVENQILKTIGESEILKGWTIQSFPENFKAFHFTSLLGCILVRYNGSDYSKPSTIGAVSQTETLEFSIVVGLRYIQKLNEAYPILKELYNNLTGLWINNEKLYPVQCEYLGHINDDIFYDYRFKIALPISSPSDKNNVFKISPFTKLKNEQV